MPKLLVHFLKLKAFFQFYALFILSIPDLTNFFCLFLHSIINQREVRQAVCPLNYTAEESKTKLSANKKNKTGIIISNHGRCQFEGTSRCNLFEIVNSEKNRC